MSQRFALAMLFAVACGGGGGGGGNTRRDLGLGAADASVSDGAVPNDQSPSGDQHAAAQTSCPCALGSYCDYATNTCVAGCVGNDHCPATDVCDTKAFVCRRVCSTKGDCAPHVECAYLGTTGQQVCLQCEAQFGDCNGDPTDGCETSLATDANCGACGAAPMHTCRVDKDGDGYPEPGGAYHTSCACPWSDKADCDDDDPEVHPGQTTSQAGNANGGDYNCDGEIEMLYDYGTVCQAACTKPVWVGTQPGCGEMGTLVQCVKDPQLGCVTGAASGMFAQLCR